jgi:hypothetical protein
MDRDGSSVSNLDNFAHSQVTGLIRLWHGKQPGDTPGTICTVSARRNSGDARHVQFRRSVCAHLVVTEQVGRLVRYVQLVHNQWASARDVTHRVLYSFGREEELDRAAIERLITSLARLLDPVRQPH